MVFQIRSDDEELFLARRADALDLRRPSGLHKLVDTTMLFAPKSGGVKRYLLAKRAWMATNRPDIDHALLVPGATTRDNGRGVSTLACPRLPFGAGYRCPTGFKKWENALVEMRPSLIEAGDPYGPGHAAQDAGERLGVPVVGFCHSDPAQLAALHWGEWAEAPVRRKWAKVFRGFDRVIAPSRHIAERLAFAGVPDVTVQPLGVDTETFHPSRADPAGVRRLLGLRPGVKLLVFAGRAAREKNVDVMLDALARLGDGYHLLLIGAGAGCRPQSNVTCFDFQKDPREVARLMAGCDAFLHANPNEPFGLVALEAMACGLPVVGVASGGVSEMADEAVGQLAPRASAACLAEAIEALFERDLSVLAAAARRRVEDRYGWDAVFTGLTELYERMTGPARPTAQVFSLPVRPH